jgi:hypothetical protein
MMGREFVKQLRLRGGLVETIRTRFELNDAGQLVEHVTLETHERSSFPVTMKFETAQELQRRWPGSHALTTRQC